MIATITLLLSTSLSSLLKPELYLDPGSGSFIIQIAIGFVVGAIVVVKAYWSKIRAFIVKDNKNNQGNPVPEKSDQPNE